MPSPRFPCSLLVVALLSASLIAPGAARAVFDDHQHVTFYNRFKCGDPILAWPTVRDPTTCKSSAYEEVDATLPISSGRYLDRLTLLVYDYSTTDDRYTLVGPFDGEQGNPDSQRGECLYAGGEWNEGGAYTYGRCLSFLVGTNRIFQARLSVREINGVNYMARFYFSFPTEDGSEPKLVQVLSIPCGYEPRGGQRISNCDLPPREIEVPTADIPRNAVAYCGVARLFAIQSTMETEIVPPIVAPCESL